MEAQGAAAACQAANDFDPSRGIPFDLFVHRRVLASALTRYRQEWTYALRTTPADDTDAPESPPADRLDGADGHESLRDALACLSTSAYALLHELYWQEHTE